MFHPIFYEKKEENRSFYIKTKNTLIFIYLYENQGWIKKSIK